MHVNLDVDAETHPYIATRLRDNKVKALNCTLDDARCTLLMELRCATVINVGILLTQVEYLKITRTKHFTIVDVAMKNLIRPFLYQA